MNGLVITRHGPPEVLEWTTVPDPIVGDREVLVRVDACAVNWADLLEREGRYPGAPTPPYVSGHDLSGTVEHVGPGVTEHRPGDRVFGVLPRGGAAAEQVVGPENQLYPTPPGLTAVEAAGAAGPFLTADAALVTLGGFQPGQTVLVHAAAGAFGSACVQLARHAGAGRIIATAGGSRKVEAVRALGADVVVDYRADDFVPIVQEVSQGHGVDLVLESVGGDVLDRSLDCIRPGGRLITVGSSSGHGSRRLRLHTFFELGILVGGLTLGAWLQHHPGLVAPSVGRVLTALDEGVRPLVDRVFPVADGPAAHAYLGNRQSVGRTVLAISPDLPHNHTRESESNHA